jgi:prepilin-type N-terminal cleavage/methylation domain-containing protein
MCSGKGFTLIELMIVVLIVGILAAVAMPLFHGRTDAAKWSEASSAQGTIRSAVKVYWSEKGGATYAGSYDTDLGGGVTVFGPKIGINPSDVAGTYFSSDAYNIDSVNAATGGCTITVNAQSAGAPADAPSEPSTRTYTEDGSWN